jgi:hypothetical protein
MSATRATAGTYVDLTATIHIDDGRSEQDRLNVLLLNYPDVIFIAGGTEQGAEASVLELVDTVRLAVSLIESPQRPSVIFAGNSALHNALRARFEGVTTLLLAHNIRPTLEDEALDTAQAKLVQAFDLYKEERSQDFSAIAGMSLGGVKPTAQS